MERELSVLLVEDEEIARSSLSRMLTLKYPGWCLYTADNGRAGLDLYREHRPWLVLTDINMPDKSGLEMAGEIRACDPQAQIVFLSAHSEASYLGEARKLGGSYYVMKPVDRHELFSVIESCLKERQGAS